MEKPIILSIEDMLGCMIVIQVFRFLQVSAAAESCLLWGSSGDIFEK